MTPNTDPPCFLPRRQRRPLPRVGPYTHVDIISIPPHLPRGARGARRRRRGVRGRAQHQPTIDDRCASVDLQGGLVGGASDAYELAGRLGRATVDGEGAAALGARREGGGPADGEGVVDGDAVHVAAGAARVRAGGAGHTTGAMKRGGEQWWVGNVLGWCSWAKCGRAPDFKARQSEFGNPQSRWRRRLLPLTLPA